MVTILTYLTNSLSFLSDFWWNFNKNKPKQPLLSSLFQDSEGTSTTTETNNISYESPVIQLFGARRMRAGHYHGGATPSSRKTVCYFSFWGRGGQEGWFFKKKIWLHQMSASHECTDTIFMTQKCIFDSLISVFFRAYRVWRPCIPSSCIYLHCRWPKDMCKHHYVNQDFFLHWPMRFTL